jgi:hypothetical protein
VLDFRLGGFGRCRFVSMESFFLGLDEYEWQSEDVVSYALRRFVQAAAALYEQS